MKNQRGAISGGVIAALSVVFVILAIVGMAISSYYSASNFGNSSEKSLISLRDNNQNILAQGQQKVMEAAQVPEMYRDDVNKVFNDAIQGRYGDGGSKAVFQMLNEKNPNLDSGLYAKIQQLIEAYRDEFKNAQTRMIDVRRSYETALGRDLFMQQGMWLKLAGYPKINLAEYKPIITDSVEQVFKAGKESGPMKLR